MVSYLSVKYQIYLSRLYVFDQSKSVKCLQCHVSNILLTCKAFYASNKSVLSDKIIGDQLFSHSAF